eukprot:Trichotokara_eunicae@DN8899_c0_g1_i1.p1
MMESGNSSENATQSAVRLGAIERAAKRAAKIREAGTDRIRSIAPNAEVEGEATTTERPMKKDEKYSSPWWMQYGSGDALDWERVVNVWSMKPLWIGLGCLFEIFGVKHIIRGCVFSALKLSFAMSNVVVRADIGPLLTSLIYVISFWFNSGLLITTARCIVFIFFLIPPTPTAFLMILQALFEFGIELSLYDFGEHAIWLFNYYMS